MNNQTPSQRLSEAREKAGFKTPTAAAAAFRDINKNTLTSNENGNRDISRKMAEIYGRCFKVSPGWILYGEDGLSGDTLAIVQKIEEFPKDKKADVIAIINALASRIDKEKD